MRSFLRVGIRSAIGVALASTSLVAQNPAPGAARPAGAPPQIPAGPGEIQGVVLDARGDIPVTRSAIAIRNKRDSSLVTGAIANDKGVFKVQGLRPGAYYARITHIGFSPLFQDFVITQAKPVVDLGQLRLKALAIELGTVAVTETRDAMTVEPDRNAYRAKDVAPAASSASEVLDHVPAVQVDGDGKVSFRGNENVAIQINGRPTPIQGAQLGQFLKGLPANVVDKIEVIPNPSAKQDPEGMAGIINIVLKQNTDLGMSAGLNANYSDVYRNSASGTLGYQSGPITTFSNAGFNIDQRDVKGFNNRTQYTPSGSVASITSQDILSEPRNSGQRFMTNIDYAPNKRDSWFNQLSVNHRVGQDHSNNKYTEMNGSGATTAEYFRPRFGDAHGWTADYTSSFKRAFVPRKHELSSELRFIYNQDQFLTDLWRNSLTSAAQTEREHNDDMSKTYQVNGQLDYTKPVGKTGKLETGYKGTFRRLDRDYVVQKDSLGSGTWTLSNLSNSFIFDEVVNAAYGVGSRSVGRVDLQGGVRAEVANRDFQLAASSYPYNKASLFPSGAVVFNQSQANQFKVSYSRRIRRPGQQELNPFPSFFDQHNVFIGNPNLNPEYTNAYEAGYTRTMRMGMIQLAPFYRQTSNIIRVDINPTDTIGGREVTSVSFKNLANSNSWGSDLNSQLRLGPKFNGFVGLSAFKMVTDGGSLSALSSDAFIWMARTNITSQVTPNLTLQGSYFYRSPQNIEKAKFSAQQMLNVSSRYKIVGDKAALTFRMNDVLNTGKFKIEAKDGRILQQTERRFGGRMAFLGIQYNYGQQPKVKAPNPEPQQQGPSTGFP